MKKALSIVLIYLAVCVLGTAFFAALFMFNTDMLSYVTNLPSKFFSLDVFLAGLAISFPLCGALALAAIILLLIGNKKNQILSLVLYLCLGFLTWIVLIPLSLSFLSDFKSKNNFKVDRNVTSTGVFREQGGGIVYNSKILENGNVDGILIDTSNFLGNEGEIKDFYNLPVTNVDAYPYSDILTKDALEPPKYVTYPIAIYTSLLTAAENSNSSGILSWLFFASFGLALLATYGLQYLSSWKLCSALFLIISDVFIVFINYFYYMGYFPSVLKNFDSTVSKFIPSESPLIVLLNLLIAAILFFFGLALGIYRNKKDKTQGNGEIQ